jgi:hypothetical protein
VLQLVVMSAQQLEIRELGLTIVDPVDFVVDVAPTGGPEAAWMLTVPISGGPPHRRRYHSSAGRVGVEGSRHLAANGQDLLLSRRGHLVR